MLNIKKSQISIFVVIAIILVIVTVFLFFNSRFEFFVSKEDKMKNSISDIVEDCIYKEGDNGIFVLGFQGGYIDVPETVAGDFRKYINFGMKIPNWDSEIGKVPTINSMEYELENFIELNSYSCIISNLKSLNEFLVINVSDELSVDVNINDQNVIVEANLPISFSQTNSEEISLIEDYKVTFDDVRLGDMYALAVEIFNLEGSSYFMEDLVLDQIYSASDYSSIESMPSEGMYFSCNRRVWTIPQLKQTLANLNNHNFKYLYFEGTYPIEDIFSANLNEQFGTEKLRDYYDLNYRFELENPKKSFANYRVEVVMPSTEVVEQNNWYQKYPYREFEVTPSNGQVVKSMLLETDLGVGKIPIPCIQIYHHLYKLDYDLVVRLTDYSEEGNYYLFQFPLRVKIENNNPKYEAGLEIVTEPLTANDESFCAQENKLYPLRIYAMDNEQNFLSDVNISYKCLNLNCDLGQTSKPYFMGVERQYAQPYLETDFPFCIGGQVIAQKEGYHNGKVRVDTTSELLDRDNIMYYDVELTPLKEYKVDVSSFLVVYKETKEGHRIRNDGSGEAIIVSLENRGYNFESTVYWPTEEGMMDTLNFLDSDDATYNVSIIYSNSEGNLGGLVEMTNWKPDLNSGNNIMITIPALLGGLSEDYNQFEAYLEYTDFALSSGDYGIIFN